MVREERETKTRRGVSGIGNGNNTNNEEMEGCDNESVVCVDGGVAAVMGTILDGLELPALCAPFLWPPHAVRGETKDTQQRTRTLP